MIHDLGLLYIPNRGYAICVLAGFFSEIPVIPQIEDLISKKLFNCINQENYRSEIVSTRPEIIFDDICLFSGHHFLLKKRKKKLKKPNMILTQTEKKENSKLILFDITEFKYYSFFLLNGRDTIH